MGSSGPKLYNGHTKSCTFLHRDIADAINVMVYTKAQGNGQDSFALFILFAHEDVPKLDKFLRKKFDRFDPISNGDVEINDE